MVSISDKFGKASIDSDHAIATTVKTIRSSGGSVLEAYDVSKFPTDTPAYFVTYKKTTAPVTGVVSVTNLVSWKALVNTGANTLTNLTLAPGYVDTGNDVGDFIECIPTSFWENSLIDGITTHANPDGTLIKQAVKDALGITTDPTGGWQTQAYTPSTITNNGNHSQDLTFTGVDLTSTLSEGMRIRTTRTVAAPIQCATFDGTNDYFSKSSPAGMTFTDDFVVSAWVKLSSYASSGIVSRYNGTSGWILQLNSSGQVYLGGYNGGSGNLSQVVSYQSLPLNKWVHITAQLDMSAFTATTTTSYIMIDGVDVPASVSRTGTNPTALIQAGNLEIGTFNGGAFFPGKIAQVAIYSAKVTQATIKASMNQGLTGSETSLVSAYSLSNSLEDLSANNNDLTANGGVLATTADSPFGNSGASTTLEYGIVMSKPVYSSGDTTMTVQTPEGCAIPTSGGISSVDYSSASVPFGFPRDVNKWELIAFLGSTKSHVITGVGAVGLFQYLVPVGKWRAMSNISASSTDPESYLGISASASVVTTPELFKRNYLYSSLQRVYNIESSANIDCPTATTYYTVSYGTGTPITIRGLDVDSRITTLMSFQNNYL